MERKRRGRGRGGGEERTNFEFGAGCEDLAEGRVKHCSPQKIGNTVSAFRDARGREPGEGEKEERKGKEENSTRLSRIPHANSRNFLNITRNPSKKGTHDDPPLLEGRFAPGFLGDLGGEDLGVDGRARVGGNGWASEGDNVSLRMKERSERRRGRDATGNVVVGRRVPAGDEFLLLLVLDVVVFLRRR